MSAAAQLTALVLICVIFGTNVWRAATQSITHDEARAFLLYVDTPLQSMWTSFDAANHVLYTVLARYAVRFCGLSELSLRLPSVLAGGAYLLAVFQLSRRVFGRRWLLPVAVAALGLNPFLLDYFSAARGYGLGLALFAWGLYLLVRYIDEDYDPPAWLLPRAGLLFGLSIAANLVFAFPVAGAGLAFFAATRRLEIDRLWGPGVVPAFVLIVMPLARAHREQFYFGATSLAESAANLLDLSLLRAVPLGPALLAGLLVLVAAYAVWQRHDRVAVFIAAALLATIAVIVAAHYATGVLYPLGRTGAYLAFLFTLAFLLLCRTRLPIAAAAAVVLAFALWRFAAAFPSTTYQEWRYDAGTKRIVAVLAEQANGRPVRLAANWLFHPSIRFYRRMWNLAWLPLEPSRAEQGDFDFYILDANDRDFAARRARRIIYRDPVSGAFLAEGGL